MSETILLTGSDGFTGQHFTSAARDHGYQVYNLESDLVDAAALRAELKGKAIDFVVHLAAISAVTHSDEAAFYQVNLLGTLNLLQAIADNSIEPKKIIVASSANIYGNAPVSPIAESAQPAPVNHYAMSKLAMEYMLAPWHDKLPLVVVRPFNYTGVGHDERFLIPKLVRHFRERQPRVELGNLDVEREFNDVRFVCDIYLKLLEKGAAGEVYNICSSKAFSLMQVIESLSRLSGHQLDVVVNPDFVRENEVQRLCGDPKKLTQCLGDLEYPALEDTLKWMLETA